MKSFIIIYLNKIHVHVQLCQVPLCMCVIYSIPHITLMSAIEACTFTCTYSMSALNIHVHDVGVGKQFRYTEGTCTSLVHLSELSNSSTEFKGMDDRVFWWQLQVLFVVFIYCIFSIML